MNLEAVMVEVATTLKGIDGIRKTWPHPVPRTSATGGTAIVSYPERIEFGITYGRRFDRIEGLAIVLIVGAVTERTALDRLSTLVDPAGTAADSAVVKLEQHDWQSCDDLTVADCVFDTVTVASIDYLAATLSATVVGPGAE